MSTWLIAVLVFAVASSANAASCELYLMVDGDSWSGPGDYTVTIELFIDIAVTSIYNSDDADKGIDFVAQSTTGSITLSPGEWIPPSSLERTCEVNGNGESIMDGFWFRQSTTNHPADTAIYSFEVTSSTDWSGSIWPVMTSMDVVKTGLTSHWWSENTYIGIGVLPEPMTIALLGLGALFLRRRKRYY